MKKNIILTGLLFFLIPVYLLAADTDKNKALQPAAQPALTAVAAQEAGYLSNEFKNIESPKPIPAPNLLSTTINLILALLFVIGLVYLVTVALKFFYIRASIPMKSENVVSVIAKEYLDSKTIMYVVEFGGRVLLLGSTAETLTLLTEIKEKETIDTIKLQADEYISKYRMKKETKFDEQLKSSYLKQGKNLVESGNRVLTNILDRFKKKDKPQ